MAAGRPVVGPARGGIAESVVDGETGFLVQPGNPNAFAEATRWLLEDAALRHTMGVNGRARVQAHFSLDQHVANMTQIYDEILMPYSDNARYRR